MRAYAQSQLCARPHIGKANALLTREECRMSTTTTLIIIVGVLIVAAILAWHFLQERRSKTLRRRFGPEYERAVHEHGNQHKAEQALVARQKRMEKIHIHTLSPQDRDRFAD